MYTNDFLCRVTHRVIYTCQIAAAALPRGRRSTVTLMSSSFYRTTPRNSSTGASGHGSHQYEKKLDAILDSIREQGRKMTTIEEKGTRTLESVENLDERLQLLENKVNNMEQVLHEGSQLRKKTTHVPPELSVSVAVMEFI